MAGKKPTMRENISSRPTDSSGRRASNADLGIGPGVAALRRAAAKEITKREGTTSPGGARPALMRMPTPSKPAKAPAVKMPKAPQIIRTTTNMKPTPMGKKR